MALVRLSGPDAVDILRRVAPGLERHPPEPRRATLARFEDPDSGRPIDRGLATYFPAPGSYTGEDVVELSGHGGWLTPHLVLDACVSAGARAAEPGEFTRRAYLNGKLDLVQVEAIGDLIEGRSPALHGAAIGQLERGLSRRIAELREELVHLEALLVHHIDFPEEDDRPLEVEAIAERADDLTRALDRLLETAPEGELLREGARTVLAGRPNAGKSSLFNALIGEERAIVTEVPGTTRDALEAVVSLGGFPFRLIDTAGLRESDERVESVGIEVAHRHLERADVVLFCVEAGRPLGEDERAFLRASAENARAPVVVLRTMADRIPEGSTSEEGSSAPGTGPPGPPGASGAPGDEEIAVSVRTGRGLRELRTRLPALVYRGLVGAVHEVPVVTRARQARGIERGRREVADFAEALRTGVPAEVASTHLRPAETALEEVLGVISDEDVLDHLFRSFCIGK